MTIKKIKPNWIIALFFVCKISKSTFSCRNFSDNGKIIHHLWRMEVLKEKIPVPNRTSDLVYNSYYRTIENGEIKLNKYDPNSQALEYFDEAEKNFRSENYASAREYYIKALSKEFNLLQNVNLYCSKRTLFKGTQKQQKIGI